MRAKVQSDLTIPNLGKVRMTKVMDLSDRWNTYKSPQDHLEKHVGFSYNNSSDPVILEIEKNDELKDVKNTVKVIEKFAHESDPKNVYVVCVGYDEVTDVSFVHHSYAKCINHVLMKLKESYLGEYVLETWKDGKKVDSFWVGGLR